MFVSQRKSLLAKPVTKCVVEMFSNNNNMSELFGRTGNFAILIRIVSCVRGEQLWGPIITETEEEPMVNVWTGFQFASFLPNSVRTPNGVIGSRAGMVSVLVHIRVWLLEARVNIWEIYARSTVTERRRITNSMRTCGYSHLVGPTLLLRCLFETEFQEQWDKFVSVEFPDMVSILAFDTQQHCGASPPPQTDFFTLGRRVRYGLDSVVDVMYALAVCCKKSWGVKAALRASLRDQENSFAFFEQQCLRQ